jgi:hypothetical protein
VANIDMNRNLGTSGLATELREFVLRHHLNKN